LLIAHIASQAGNQLQTNRPGFASRDSASDIPCAADLAAVYEGQIKRPGDTRRDSANDIAHAAGLAAAGKRHTEWPGVASREWASDVANTAGLATTDGLQRYFSKWDRECEVASELLRKTDSWKDLRRTEDRLLFFCWLLLFIFLWILHWNLHM